LTEKQKVLRREGTYYHAASEAPAHEVRLRGYGDESTVVVDAESGQTIDRLDKFRALRLFYPGAIYLHRGDTYVLLDHDTERNVVRVRRADVTYYTDPVTGTAVNHVDVILAQRPIGTGQVCLGEVFAVLDTPLYEKVHFYTLDRISQHATEVPPVAYDAMSFWVTVPEALSGEVARLGLDAASGMKGVLYCVSRVLPLFLTSDANDFDWSLGSRNTPWHTMFWYEFFLQGIGHAEQAYERLEEILGVALEQLLTCDCEDGCPNCTSRLITPYHVRNIELGEGWVASRRAAAVVLRSLLSGEPAAESLAVVDSPREKRGLRYLPSVTGEARRREPHRLPLDDRLRQLMLRKLERARSPREAVDHPIDLRPPVGAPKPEAEDSLQVSDATKRAGAQPIRHSGDPTARGLRRRLRQVAERQGSQPPPPSEAALTEPAAGAAAQVPRPASPGRAFIPAGRPGRGAAEQQEATSATGSPTEAAAAPPVREEPAADAAIRAGDALARLARRRKSREGRSEGGKAEP
jgi:hypothetical protein